VRVKICTQCMRTLEKYKRDGQIVEQPDEKKSAEVKAETATKTPAKKAPAKKPAKSAA